MPRLLLLATAVLVSLTWSATRADDDKKLLPNKAVERIAAEARKSVVVITVTGRDGKREGLGTGFIIAADGLIATNLHVIGEARPITVQLADGQKHEATAVHATDRAADLAIIKIDAKDLKPLTLGDSDKIPQGAGIVALGNPHGLKHSVVAGVVSGRREIEGRSMIQLAMPVEPGNSGGPVVDLEGRVLGVVTMKSAVAENLGFAMPINALKPLLQKPNPVAMERWLTIGALDPDEWHTLFGARWRQRAGRITVEGTGTGFGGRTMCLAKRPMPQLPFELAVTVRLDDESGAAGLVFHADGKDKHYGFYATSGGVRLTRFDGPDVFSWKILQQEKTPHYQPGNWNTLKIRIEKEKLRCYVNDHLVCESADTELTSGEIGLVAFRGTKATFKGFQSAAKIETVAIPAGLKERVGKIAPAAEIKPDALEKLLPDAAPTMSLLRERAKMLEEQAAQLRKLAAVVHGKRVQGDMLRVLAVKEPDIDLVHAALLIARLDNDELDVKAYRAEVERLAKRLAADLPKDADAKTKLAALNKFLFADRGFHGSRGDYYNKANSYLNEVLDDREGLPITLSVLYMELGRRIGLPLEGVPLPGHFMVRHVVEKGDGELIDVFDGGKTLTQDEAAKKVRDTAGIDLKKEHLMAPTKRAIVVRMLQNLTSIARNERDGEAMLRYLDLIVTVTPDTPEERWLRAQLRYHAGQKEGSLEDVQWLLEKQPEGIELEAVQGLQKLLKSEQ